MYGSRIRSTFISTDLTVSYTDLEEEYSWLSGRRWTSTRKVTSAREHKYAYTLHMELSMLRSHSYNGHMYTVDMRTVEYYTFTNALAQE